jgi:hypothetical protein
MDTPTLGSFEFPDELGQHLESAAEIMEEKGLDELEIPNQPDFVLVRIESETYRKKKDELKPMAPFQSKGNVSFVVCYK